MGKDKKLDALLNKTKVLNDEIHLRLKEQDELFNTEDRGYLEVEEERERTLKVTQNQLKEILPVQAAQNIFDLTLNDFGPYNSLDVTKNGKYLLLGGKKGHLSIIDWKQKNLVLEFHAKQLIRDVAFLQNNQMFAVAQKKYLHIYDANGIELHCLRDHLEPKILEYLPYHYLLATATKAGFLKYLDISIGKQIAEVKTKRGEPVCMEQNPQNAIICMGHSSGEVTMWTPNMGSTPVVRMLTHPSAPVTSLSVSRCGKYMTTTGKDSRFKIWDVRNTYKCLYDYFTPIPASSSSFSDTGLIAIGFGNEAHIWKNSTSEKQKAPYMKHKLSNKQSSVKKVRFLPFEDVLGISHDLGYTSIIVPGSGEPNFDAFEANPFETKKSRGEAEVHGLLEKLQPDSISLKVNTIGLIDNASNDIKAKEQKELMEQEIEKKRKKDKKKKNKARGKGKVGREMENKVHQVHEVVREKNKILYKKEYERTKQENDVMGNDLEFLGKINEKFDPMESYFENQNKKKYAMQIKYWKNLQSPIDGMQKISALCWSPNSKRMAVATADRVVHLFDENGEKRDKFSTRPADKDNKSYIVRAMAFSPDNQKLAIAQSDNIVFIYKIGTEWGDKKSICNKFSVNSSVTCMVWPFERHNELIFGLAEGKVKLGILKTNKSQSIFGSDSFVVSVTASPNGQQVASGHLDGSIITFNLETKAKSKIQHSTIPYALAWGSHIAAGGNDGKIAFYEPTGDCFQRFDYSKDEKVKEFTCASFNATGETCIIGNFNRFYVYNFNQKRPQWDEICCKVIENYYSVTACGWKSDGSKIGIGSLCGSVDVFDVCLKKARYKGKFEFTYVSLSQVIVKRIENGQRIVLKSNMGHEISKINIYQDRYLVASTNQTLLLGDMDSCKLSELPWRGSGNEKFDFSNPNICMVFNAGELSIVEYGVNDVIGTCRTENIHPNMISARLNYSEQELRGGQPTKIIAYLLDAMTICIQDLRNNQIQATITHDSKIDYLELNPGGSKLLFRDKRRQLHLYNIKEQKKQTLLNYCKYVSWVPNSDVVVAQNRNNLCVWYSIEEPDKVTMYQIKGDVETIQRTEGKTEVIVDDGANAISYALDEALIAFGSALEYKGLDKAVQILEPLELTPETEANWKTLAKLALEQQNLYVAERCYAALGNISKADYLRKINKLVAQEGIENFRVQAKLAVLDKQFHRAEAILLQHDEVEEAMAMYQELHRWDESIKIAEKKNHPDTREFKDNYFQWLIETNQEAKAAEVKEREGDYQTAIGLYLKGGLPAKAANVVSNYNVGVPHDQLEKISAQLTSAGMHEKAGEFFEKMNILDRALDSYVRGHAFRKAVDLARRAFPSHVVNLEEEWGDWLVSQKQLDLAIEHYVQAGIFNKAIEAAINARKWNRAVQLIANQPPEISRPYYKQIAKHYAEIRQHDLAEKYFISAGEFVEAFEMYVRANKWDQAYQVISRYLPESEYTMLYVQEARKFEGEGHFKDAERMYLTANEPDLAINMYKKAKQYDNMIRLVMKFRKDLLKDTHQHLAQQLEMEGNLKQAEHHYIESGAWHYAVDMYRAHDSWEEALRVAKTNGTQKELGEIAIKVAENMGADKGTQFLIKNGLIEAAIDFEANQEKFDQAFSLANSHAKYKLPEVHLKYALHLEDENRFKEAEEEFIKANKPQEAINMYEHKQDWHSALQVARQYHPESVNKVFLNQAKFYLERRDYGKAEQCYLNAKEPEKAINMYQEAKMYGEALRVANKHAPHLVHQINENYSRGPQVQNQSGDEILRSAKMWEESRDYQKAIDRYLEITEQHFQNPEHLEEIWNNAFNLAMSYAKDRIQEVVSVVASRLLKIQKFESAGDILESVGFYEKAIDAFLAIQKFDRALDCASQVRPVELQNMLIDRIQQQKKQMLIQNNKIGKIVESGDLSGLEMLAQRGQWEECLSLAEKQGADVLNNYLMKFSKLYLQQGNFKETARQITKYGCPAIQQMLPVYKTIAVEVLATVHEMELQILKEMLQKLCENLGLQLDQRNPIYQEFYKYLLITHFLLLKGECARNGITRVMAKLCTSLLRYTKEIRADKAFLDAGEANRREGINNMAFMFFNRYLDLFDAIEDPEGAGITDNSDFQETDIPSPFEIPLPEKNLISNEERDNIRDWVLSMNMDNSIHQALSKRHCENCGTEIYEGSLICHSCKTQWEPCIISGYPLVRSQAIACKFCSKGAIRDYWNDYIAATMHCPWCKSMQTPV